MTASPTQTGEIDWAKARNVTILIQQNHRYEYPGRITNLRHRLIVVPPNRHGTQRLVRHEFRVLGSNLESECTHDSFGNVVIDLAGEVVDRQVEFATLVVVEHAIPSSEDEGASSRMTDRRLGEPSPLTRPNAALRATAASSSVSGLGETDRVALIGQLVHDHFRYEPGSTTVQTTAADAWSQGRGVCQDYAHCMLALCRLSGIPARYVSGHLLGEGASHAWVEALVHDADGTPNLIAFDPTHNRCTGPRYVTIAVGRDYLDAAPTAGTFLGAHPGTLSTRKHAAVTRVDYQ